MQGLEAHLVQSLRERFGGRPTLGFAETCKLLNVDAKTLRDHIRRGNIRFRQTGLGKIRVRREFALHDVVDFYTRALRGVEPTGPAAGRPDNGRRPGFLDGYAARRTPRKERKSDAIA